MQERVLKTKNIEILWEHQTLGLTGDGVVEGAVLVKKQGTPEEQKVTIKIDGFFLAIGHKPNSDIFKDYLTTDSVGYIKTIPGTSKTNVDRITSYNVCYTKLLRVLPQKMIVFYLKIIRKCF